MKKKNIRQRGKRNKEKYNRKKGEKLQRKKKGEITNLKNRKKIIRLKTTEKNNKFRKIKIRKKKDQKRKKYEFIIFTCIIYHTEVHSIMYTVVKSLLICLRIVLDRGLLTN